MTQALRSSRGRRERGASSATATVLQFCADADNLRLAHLTGALDVNLRQIENEFSVRIRRRGNVFRIEGSPEAARSAQSLLEGLQAQAQHPISVEDVQLQVFEQKRFAAGAHKPASGDDPRVAEPPASDRHSASPDASHSVVLLTRRPELHARTPVQRNYLQSILAHDISIGIGPAGTGKTYLAVACAVDALERDTVERIVLTRPAVEAGERLGFLPGDLAQKVDPTASFLDTAIASLDLIGDQEVLLGIGKRRNRPPAYCGGSGCRQHRGPHWQHPPCSSQKTESQ